MNFNDFLSAAPARDYIFRNEEYDSQIEHAAKMIKDADYVLVGAGAGLSTAAGAQYGGMVENFLRKTLESFRQNTVEVAICRICIPRDFIRIRMRNLSGDTGQNKRFSGV